ncbi:MAG TPA: glycosyltransferase family 4 protein [Terrimicrobiaceae bacterium]|nr:glycosyltransferase family 4 protein [Terrimicrobiaceae bacterium]
MRIALFAWDSLDSIFVGGAGVHVSELGRALATLGHEVHLFTRPAPGRAESERANGIFVHRCGFDLDHDFLRETANMCHSFERHFLATQARVGEFDVVHAHDWLTADVLTLLEGQCRARRILTMHSTEYGRCGNVVHFGRSEAVRHREWQGIFVAERVICVSGALRDEIVWHYSAPREKCQVIYNGIHPEGFDFACDPGEIKSSLGVHPMAPTILFAGRVVYQKGVDILIDAIPYVLKHVPTAMFVIAGDGEMRWDLEHASRIRGLDSNMRWLGKVPREPLRYLLKSCDAVCVPSRNEPFGIVILEAWCAAKPVVATVIGGPGEFVTHDRTGFSINPNSDSVAWGIGHIFADFNHARWMGRNGRREVEQRFTWDVVARQTLEAYQDGARHRS